MFTGTGRVRRYCWLAFLALFAAAVGSAQPAHAEREVWEHSGPIAHTALISESRAVEPGGSFWIAIDQELPPGWHTYWRNPGDAGQAIEVTWELPAGFQRGAIQWPAPQMIPFAPGFLDFGYEGRVILPVRIEVGANVPAGLVSLRAHADYVVCNQMCVSETAKLDLLLRVGSRPQADQIAAPIIRQALGAVPAEDQSVQAAWTIHNNQLLMRLSGGAFNRDAKSLRNVRFVPFSEGIIHHGAEQTAQYSTEGTQLAMSLAPARQQALPNHPAGLVFYEIEQDGLWQSQRIAVGARHIAQTPAPTPATNGPPEATRWVLVVLAAFAGGALLNLMPCVFPILSIKALHLVQAGQSDQREAMGSSMFFAIGTVSSFLALAGALLALRAGGESVGWGFQLQIPLVVAGLSVVLLAMALNVLGALRIRINIPGLSIGPEVSSRLGGLVNGVLAVIVATPCVGPLTAGALGLALTQSAWAVLAVAVAMGLGLAAPLVALAHLRGLARIMPKPGPWMIRFKQLMALPLIVAAGWLLWVLFQQAGWPGTGLTVAAMAMMGLAAWLHRGGAERRGLSAAPVLLAVALVIGAGTMQPHRVEAEPAPNTWSAERVAQLQVDGHAVLVDVTAAWCVSCQINAGVLTQTEVSEMLANAGVVILVADWTNRDPAITDLVEQSGRAGIPLFLLYPAGGGPAQVLPAVLSADSLRVALSQTGQD